MPIISTGIGETLILIVCFKGQTCAKGLTYRPSVQVCPFFFTCISHKFFVYLYHNQRFI